MHAWTMERARQHVWGKADDKECPSLSLVIINTNPYKLTCSLLTFMQVSAHETRTPTPHIIKIDEL
jgi:hypothetical protein